MSASSRRAATAERRAAKALGGDRVRYQGRYESAPDIRPITIGDVCCQPEVKHRAHLPRLITGALSQAAAYAPAGAVPLAVLFEHGNAAAVVALPLDAFARITGLAVAELPQVERPIPRRKPSSRFAFRRSRYEHTGRRTA